jgi:O-acetyl-ADP-ribose deacetylase (regulator of RNase III)
MVGGLIGITKHNERKRMTYTEIEGDLLTLELPAIGHGCNCRGSMGGGIALQLRNRYPAMDAAYRAKCRDGSFRLGGFFVWETDDSVIYNLATQLEPGPDSIRAALADAGSRGIPTLGLPQLGSGIGGLDWAKVADILRSAAAESPVGVTVVSRPKGRPS